jgi:5-methyltetrahydrofolate--homocysteine methyltransferase
VADRLQQLKIMSTERMGMTMDESEQLYRKQSTTALIVYHPVAKYFSA